jgi:hypothetical protein
VRVPVAFAAASLIVVAASATACSSGAKTAGSLTPPPASTAAAPAAAQATATAAAAAGGAASTLDVCSLLSATRASAIVGVSYSAATEVSGGKVCDYATTHAPIPLSIMVEPGAGAAAWTEELGTIQEGSGSAPATLTGVGDRAAGGGTEVGVQDGQYIIDILGGDPNVASPAFPKSVALAQAIIAALR